MQENFIRPSVDRGRYDSPDDLVAHLGPNNAPVGLKDRTFSNGCHVKADDDNSTVKVVAVNEPTTRAAKVKFALSDRFHLYTRPCFAAGH
jgi:hypothetical protein